MRRGSWGRGRWLKGPVGRWVTATIHLKSGGGGGTEGESNGVDRGTL